MESRGSKADSHFRTRQRKCDQLLTCNFPRHSMAVGAGRPRDLFGSSSEPWEEYLEKFTLLVSLES